MMQHHKLTAYLIGAVAGGTLVVIPYVIIRPMLAPFYPGISEIIQPYFMLPIIWGLWNMLYSSAILNRKPNIGIWGAILGFILGLSICFFMYAGGYWFWAGILIPIFVPVIYKGFSPRKEFWNQISPSPRIAGFVEYWLIFMNYSIQAMRNILFFKVSILPFF